MLRAQRRASWRPAPASASLPGHLCGECVCQMVGLRAGGGSEGGGMNRYTSMCAVVLLSPMLHYWLLFRRGGDVRLASPGPFCVDTKCSLCLLLLQLSFLFFRDVQIMCTSLLRFFSLFFHVLRRLFFFLYSASPFHISL